MIAERAPRYNAATGKFRCDRCGLSSAHCYLLKARLICAVCFDPLTMLEGLKQRSQVLREKARLLREESRTLRRKKG